MGNTSLNDPIKNLGDKRMAICKKCGLYDNGIFSFHPRCSSDKYMNPKTNETSKTPKDGYVRGCGCYLEYKVYNIHDECPAKKW